MKRKAGGSVKLDGIVYIPAGVVCSDLPLSRATLWRWRRAGKVPAGRLYRDRQILFTSDEVEAIRRYSNRIEPLVSAVAPTARTGRGTKLRTGARKRSGSTRR